MKYSHKHDQHIKNIIINFLKSWKLSELNFFKISENLFIETENSTRMPIITRAVNDDRIQINLRDKVHFSSDKESKVCSLVVHGRMKKR
mgnify:CR=1 FL=1